MAAPINTVIDKRKDMFARARKKLNDGKKTMDLKAKAQCTLFDDTMISEGELRRHIRKHKKTLRDGLFVYNPEIDE